MGKVQENEKPKISMQDILANYIQDKNGNIYNILQDKKDINNCYLRTGNTYVKFAKKTIRQGLVNGKYKGINEHQWKKWVAEDNAYIEVLSQKLLKRVILAQLIVELDDELIKDHEGQNNMVNHIKKSQKACERVAEKYFDRLYESDQNLFQNLTKAIEETTSKLSKLKVYDFLQVNKMIDDMVNNPDKYLKMPVEIETFE